MGFARYSAVARGAVPLDLRQCPLAHELARAHTRLGARGAAERLAAMLPDGHSARIHLTLTDDHPWAQAFVIIEAIKD